jgi:hypothetical protein
MNVVISYRNLKEDHAFVEKLDAHLKKQGIHLWIDNERMKPGLPWRPQLLEQLKSCDACVAVLSPGYLASEVCRMEIFIARSFGRQIIPVMLDDCFSALRDHEETKGLEDVFMMRMFRLSAVGLPMTESDVLVRLADALVPRPSPAGSVRPVYISYTTKDAEFATEVARGLAARDVPTWIATLDVRVGENWRDAQARAMMRASAHVVVLDENIVKQNVLRTEILLSEALGLNTLAVLPPRLIKDSAEEKSMRQDLRHSDQTYRRLDDTQYFSCAKGVEGALDQLRQVLVRPA